MHFEFSGITHSLWFKYTLHDGKPETVCVISTGHEPDIAVVSAGSAICNPCDRFEKVVGRELALYRCLKNAVKNGMTNEFWKAAMGCYLNRGRAKAKAA